jgi:dimethylhistidine N-methyltransferase
MSSLQAATSAALSNAGNFACLPDAAQAELALGLNQRQARIAPKYFYDALGSKLFEAICQLDEYYLTRAEAGIFSKHAGEIAAAAGTGTTLIDLGAGNCAKAAGLFPALRPGQYVPVDISAEFLHAAVAKLQAEFPALPMHPAGLDFSENFSLPPQVSRSKRLFFYPGSSIGNFSPLAAGQMLGRLRAACGPDGGVLIGADLVKDARILEAAYDDALGVTAAFNLNVLRHVNALLQSDFDISAWRHLASFNAAQSRIEMHLQARHDLTVNWPGGNRSFAAGETIHTENSYKYTKAGFVDLLAQAGFGDATCWTDSAGTFMVCHARAI